MIKNLIFDWSGVINDNALTSYHLVVKILAHYQIAPITLAEFRHKWEQPYMLFYHQYLPNVSRAEEDKVYQQIYPEIAKEYPAKPYPGIVDLLRRLKAQGKRIIVISADHWKFIQSEIAAFGLEEVIAEVKSDVHGKAEVLAEIIKRDKLVPEETIIIGDTTHEVTAGKSVGLVTAAVTWGIHEEQRLLSAKPDYLVRSVLELERIIQTRC